MNIKGIIWKNIKFSLNLYEILANKVNTKRRPSKPTYPGASS